MRCARSSPSAIRPLEAVKDQARAAVLAAKLRALSEEKAKKLVERARTGAKLEDLAAEVGARSRRRRACAAEIERQLRPCRRRPLRRAGERLHLGA